MVWNVFLLLKKKKQVSFIFFKRYVLIRIMDFEYYFQLIWTKISLCYVNININLTSKI